MNEMTRPIEVITQEINFYKFQAGQAIIEIGKRLCEAKQCLPHGAWGEWLQNEVEFSERTAQNYMQIAKKYKNPQLITDMGNSVTKALLLLSVPEDEREEFVGEAHEIDGEAKTVAEMTTKEMEQLLKKLEAERAEKEKLQSQLDLFQDEAEKAKEAAVDAAVDAAYKDTEDKLETLVAQKEAAEQAQKAAEEKVAAMETEMDELRMQAEQTALPDESELERVRKEAEETARQKAEAAMQKKLDKAKKDADKARKEAAEAQAAIEAHEAAQKEAEEATLRVKEELAQVKADTEKKLRIAASDTVTQFKFLLEDANRVINQMLDCISQAETAEETEDAEKMKKVLSTLCQRTQDNL